MDNDDIRICVLQRGRIAIGRFTLDGAMVTLTDSRNILRWGTSKGLEQLANEGPLTGVSKSGRDTELGDRLKGTRMFHILTVIEILECNAEVWRARL